MRIHVEAGEIGTNMAEVQPYMVLEYMFESQSLLDALAQMVDIERAQVAHLIDVDQSCG